MRCISTSCFAAEHGPGHRIGTERGAALLAHIIGQIVNLLEFTKGIGFGHADRLRNRIVDKRLQRGLHVEMRTHRQLAGGDKSIGNASTGSRRLTPSLTA